MTDTKKKIILILVNTKDHEIPKRDILMRVSYRLDFEVVYQDMIAQHIIEETGAGKQGKQGSTKIVRLLNPNG